MAASATSKARCIACGKERTTSKCEGCLQEFCYKHLGDHRQDLSKQLDEVEVRRDVFRQTINEQKSDPQKHSLIQEIDKWERDSIKKIRETAEEARKLLFNHITVHFNQIETKLNKLTDQLREGRKEEDFFESDLNQWNKELAELTEQLAKPSNIIVQQDPTALITKISVNVSPDRALLHSVNTGTNVRWTQNGITVAGGNEQGNGLNQLEVSYGLFVADDQTVYVADTDNHRIVEWKRGATNGQVVAGGNEEGSRNNQLNSPTDVIFDKKNDCLIICDLGNKRVVQWPRQIGSSGQTIISAVYCHGLVMDHDGYLYVSDIENNEVKRWRIGDTTGTVVAGGNERGNRLNQLNCPRCIFVDQDRSVYVSDWRNHRVMKWLEGAKEGIVVAGGQGRGDGLAQLHYPRGLVADQSGAVYVADIGNHRIMCWSKGATQGSIVLGGYRGGEQANPLHGPTDLSFDSQGNLYVLDYGHYRVQKFNIDLN